MLLITDQNEENKLELVRKGPPNETRIVKRKKHVQEQKENQEEKVEIRPEEKHLDGKGVVRMRWLVEVEKVEEGSGVEGIMEI
jgi:hypothetical protein